MCQLLLEYGADPVSDLSLVVACIKNRIEVLKIMVDHGVNLDTVCREFTPL